MRKKSMYRNIGGKKIHINQIAAQSRQFSVNNNTISKTDFNKKNVLTLWHEIRTTKYDTPVYGKMFEVDKDGHYHLIEIDHSWKPERHKQPKRLHKKQSQWSKWIHCNPYTAEDDPNWVKTKNYPACKSNYPTYIMQKMNHTEYMEKLVEHKLAKWERKNPKPMDMFTEDVEKWMQLRENMKMHFRDVVVSIYDKLPLIGRFKIGKTNATFIEKKVAEIKDINGEGHNINHLNKSSKLLKVAQKVTDQVHAKHADLVSTNLKDHKRTKGRIILPTNLMMMSKAA